MICDMRLFRNVLLAALILLIAPSTVKAAPGGSLLLMLDSGFVDRPVELAVFDNDVVVGWGSGVLVGPSELEIVYASAGTVELSFSDPASLASGSTINVAVRVSGGEDALSVSSGGTVETYAATAVNGIVRASVPVSGNMVVSAVIDADAVPVPVEEVKASVNVTASAPVPTDETLFLMLDSGFVGRPVSLEVFGGELTVAWNEHALVAPTTLTLTRTQGGVAEDQEEAAKGVTIEFGDSAAVSGEGVFTVSHKAHRPPVASEHPEVNIFSAGQSMEQGSFAGDRISYAVPACTQSTYVPAYRDGIMRSGIASWYAYKGCLCAASPDVPKGTRMKVSRQDDPNTFTVVTINDYGPDRSIHPDRVIDLDKVAFSRIGNTRGGVLAVDVEVLDPEDPLYAHGDELPPPPWRW